MRFIHIADVHLGAQPDAGPLYSENRGRELWDTFEYVLGVCEDDEIVDQENRKCYGNIEAAIKNDSESAMANINYLLVCRSLERIADLCTNIAEDVIYMERSMIVRHNLDERISELKDKLRG